MTSEIEALKTNEYLRRRKLRLQQVREQSKDIAKKIRQRAKVEKLRQIIELDANKEKEYFQHQEKLVKRLEQFYVKSLQNVGASHKNANQVTLEDIPEKPDLSKKRGKQAAAELRRQKQEKLDKQKKLLDRKLHARETANELSREKSSVTKSKSPSKSVEDVEKKTDNRNPQVDDHANPTNDKPEVVTCDMATQSGFEPIPQEWEPHIPVLSLPKDDKESPKQSSDRNYNTTSLQNNRRPNLFALSDEMPSSLRGGISRLIEEEHALPKPSLTLVSEYIQNRDLRLREFDSVKSNKRSLEDLHSIKQTILRTRATEGIASNSVCHVADVQVVPVPSWQAEVQCGYCPHNVAHHKRVKPNTRQFKTVTNSQINKIFSSIRPLQNRDWLPSPVLRGSSPFRRVCPRTCNRPGKDDKVEKLTNTRSGGSGKSLTKKNSVTMYNHSTRDTKDVPCSDKKLVTRDTLTDEDAYSQAMKASTSDNKEKDHQKRLQETRNKIAVTKQQVDKEYKDTMAFLNSLPKSSSKPIKTAYQDERRQHMQREDRQRKLAQEYRKIEKDCKYHNMTPKHSKYSQRKTKSPKKNHSDDDHNAKDYQYSWMPVPESDGNLAIHTIPTSLKERKSGSTVKFSTVDSYHEYRSRHKHTPPTKDTTDQKTTDALVMEQDNDSTDYSSISTDNSSIENLEIQAEVNRVKKGSYKDTDKLADAERIIIYKIMDSKKEKARNARFLKDLAKTLSSSDKDKIVESLKIGDKNGKIVTNNFPSSTQIKNSETRMSMEFVNEGIYKTVNEKGDNITSMYFLDGSKEGEHVIADENASNARDPKKRDTTDTGTTAKWESGDDPPRPRFKNGDQRKSKCEASNQVQIGENVMGASAATSTSSFKTATNDKATVPDNGFIKLLDEGGNDAGKFYIGATGFLKDDDYEVVIQLRKKDGVKDGKKEQEKEEAKDDQKSQNRVDKKGQQKESTEEEPFINKGKEFEPAKNIVTTESMVKSTTSESNEYVVGTIPMDSTNLLLQQNIVEFNKLNRLSSQSNKEQNERNYSNDKISMIESTSQANNLLDTGVCTTLPNSFVTASHVTKADSVTKPGTSMSTQTAATSPNQRPVLIHMSSSTSTAYMSPPELILPRFLKNNYKLNCDEIMNEMKRNPVQPRAKFDIIDQEGYCEEYADCRCRRCRHARKITLTKLKPAASPDRRKINTPPNTARSITSEYGCDNYDNARTPRKRESTSSSPKRLKMCKNCESRSRSKFSLRSYSKNKRDDIDKYTSRNLIMCVNSGTTKKSKSNAHESHNNKNKKINRKKLNPVIKWYIDKLLTLNKEGIKAVEVMNQDCSSVPTPGSSIIEVSCNKGTNKSRVESKISLEQLKDLLMEQLLEKCKKQQKHIDKLDTTSTASDIGNRFSRMSKKKSVHKVKSLNISKHLLRSNKSHTQKQTCNVKSTKHTTPRNDITEKTHCSRKLLTSPKRIRTCRSKSSPSPSSFGDRDVRHKKAASDILNNIKSTSNSFKSLNADISSFENHITSDKLCTKSVPLPFHRATITSSDSELNGMSMLHTEQRKSFTEKKEPQLPKTWSHNEPHTQLTTSLADCQAHPGIHEKELEQQTVSQKQPEMSLNTATQTNQVIDQEVHYMKLAEDKLQNMEKIADLTEKCTKRLSNLAKVLEEVRKNKSLAYSQVSDSTSDSDRRSDKNGASTAHTKASVIPYEPDVEQECASLHTSNTEVKEDIPDSACVSFLGDIPKPDTYKYPILSSSETQTQGKTSERSSASIESVSVKSRGKPPPALSRRNLKHGQDFVVPHELSTVIEVDSPLSIKHKNYTVETNSETTKLSHQTTTHHASTQKDEAGLCDKDLTEDPDLLQTNIKSRRQTRNFSTDSSDDSKIQMMDLKQFNEIMLKPFISIQEYAKQCHMGVLDEGSHLEDIPKDDRPEINDDLSSLHSDGSLPDVIAELLKRNIINEPFKFETASNMNSTTVSSESTLSVLALSKVRKEKKRSSIGFRNKENVVETSDTLSMSSNPDLENAFKKLGMGWASSTLKKTKERLALSSSSNTSSSSLSQYKLKNFNNHEAPALVTDAVSSVLNLSNNSKNQAKLPVDNPKNAEQQTSLTNSMTVKQFLTNELAKKITFTSHSHRDDTEEEFVSLYETKMPEEMKQPLERQERSMESAGNNRARTSTPVQIYKSMTYQSSSSSNVSNGLFSNADELSSVKGTSNSLRNHSTSEKDDLTIPDYSLRMKKGSSDRSKSD